MARSYEEFLASKAPRPRYLGFEPEPMPSHLFDFQADVTQFALRVGSCGEFLDTGMGKTAVELEFVRQTSEKSNGKGLLLTDLAVAPQILKEANRWGYKAQIIKSGDDVREGINICNYDRLHLLYPEAFGSVSLDESSILKSFTGATTRALISAFEGFRYRMCATATPAPNDHMELGQHAEFLGQMSSMEMLSRWFINDTSTASQNWRLKGHAETSFWDWMASWSRCAESPADLGYDASRFVLPPLNIVRHQVAGDIRAPMGELFAGDVSATNLHDVKRQTSESRAASVTDLVTALPNEPWLLWCDTDYEADALRKRMPFAVEVRGSHSTEYKEKMLEGFSDGSVRVLITKPKIAGRGMNWQHCANIAYVGRSFSYEAWYQSVRRFWRFGQTRPVNCHIMVAEGEDQIGRVIDRKAADHNKMKRAMAFAMRRDESQTAGRKIAYDPKYDGRLPSWLFAA